MACDNERRPRCGEVTTISTPDPLVFVGSLITWVIGLGSSIWSVVKAGIDNPPVGVGMVIIGAMSITVLMIIVIAMFVFDNCAGQKGLPECIAGVVNHTVPEFSDPLSVLAPYTALPPRIDIVVKSKYWDVVENGQAFVFCTGEVPPRRSEIMRCYYKSDRVCAASIGSLIGAIIGAIIGAVIFAAIVVAVIAAMALLVALVAGACVGSAGFLCVVAIVAGIVVGALIMAAAAAAGAAVVGVIVALVMPHESAADDQGIPLANGALVTVFGNMVRRDGRLFSMDKDNGANVLWFVTESQYSGVASNTITQRNPFSYCEINDDFPIDGCPTG